MTNRPFSERTILDTHLAHVPSNPNYHGSRSPHVSTTNRKYPASKHLIRISFLFRRLRWAGTWTKDGKPLFETSAIASSIAIVLGVGLAIPKFHFYRSERGRRSCMADNRKGIRRTKTPKDKLNVHGETLRLERKSRPAREHGSTLTRPREIACPKTCRPFHSGDVHLRQLIKVALSATDTWLGPRG